MHLAIDPLGQTLALLVILVHAHDCANVAALAEPTQEVAGAVVDNACGDLSAAGDQPAADAVAQGKRLGVVTLRCNTTASSVGRMPGD